MFALIAQLVEQIPLKDKVPGSIPGERTGYHLTHMMEYGRVRDLENTNL